MTGASYPVKTTSRPTAGPTHARPGVVATRPWPQAGPGPHAAVHFARACSDLNGVYPAPVFRWATDGLVARVPGAGTGLVLPPDDDREDEPSGSNLHWAAIGAGAALVASALTASAGGRHDLRWTCSVSDILSPPAPPLRPTGEWLGYARTGRGWMGLVLPGPEAQATWEAAKATLGVLRMPPLAAAALIQRLGIAAFPARAPEQTERAHPAPENRAAVRVPPTPLLLSPTDGCVVPTVTGRRVVDLGRVVAGPFTARILEDLGADVRRVRPPDPADGPTPGEDVIDLSDPAGANEIAALVSRADLVVENFRPRGWAAVRQVIAREPRRRIAIRGFDAGSPLRNWKMYGFLVEGFFGIGTRPCDLGGRAEGGAVWDRLCGVVAAAAAIQQLKAGAPTPAAGEISQVGLARMWIATRRAAKFPDRDEERLWR